MTIPELVKEEIKKMDKKSEVILFGSRARGDYRAESDWDFLILLEKETTGALKDRLRERLYDLELETDEVISSIIHSKSNWEAMAVTPIYQIIKQEGIRV